jgi:hypothetical protein
MVAGTKIGAASKAVGRGIAATPATYHKAKTRYYEVENKITDKRLELERKRFEISEKKRQIANLRKKRGGGKPPKPFNYSPFG